MKRLSPSQQSQTLAILAASEERALMRCRGYLAMFPNATGPDLVRVCDVSVRQAAAALAERGR